MLSILLTTFLLGAAVVSADYTPEALADEVKNLPGAENLQLNFRQFSGYLPVTATKNLHYWFVESQSAPATDPIAFWTNGGPGCSGLLGFMTEQGPLRPNKDMTLSLNPHSWNTIANMVFIEAPCGVGFSYSSDESGADYKTDDTQTAEDNFALLQQFFTRFPQYRTNDLYITSESYGGHYMPTLAKQIVDRNAAGKDPLLNFKGFAVGNPATTFYSAIPAGLDTYWGHQLISKPLWDRYQEECITNKNFTKCEDLFLAMYAEVGNLNPYALDYPVCLEDSPRKAGRAQRTWFLNHQLAAMHAEYSGVHDQGLQNIRKAIVGLEPVSDYEPCASDYMTTYLNKAEVKAALHVNSDVEWRDCSRTIRYNQLDGAKSMVPIYKYLIDKRFGLNILVYSGDDDEVCATIGTQSWIWDMGYHVEGRRWQQWLTTDGQTAGYLTKFRNTKLAFATVHGAGHEVPAYKPQAALELFAHYIKGEWTDA
jgi:carboxypeptidase C (cathepsin A)